MVPSSVDHTDSRPGRRFERKVADAYRALGYTVEPNVALHGQQVDLIARREIEGSPTVVLAVECKDHAAPVDNQTVQEFVATVTALRAASAINGGVVVSANGFTAPARAVAQPLADITLFAWDDLISDTFSVTSHLHRLVHEYEHAPFFTQYLSLAVEVLTWADLSAPPTASPSLDDIVADWMRQDGSQPRGQALVVLADFGSGKTTLLRHLQYLVAKQHIDGANRRVPLFVPLRSFRDTQDVMAMCRAAFRDSYHRDLSSDLLWQHVQNGSLCLLLDGFDEMLERSDSTNRAARFHDLLPFLHAPSPAVLTSRPSYFVDRGELDAFLALLREHEAQFTLPRSGDRSVTAQGADRLRRILVDYHREVRPDVRASHRSDARRVRVVRLLALDSSRIATYLHSRAQDIAKVGATPDAVSDFIARTYDLTDLASRPLLLSLIVDTVIIGGLDVDDPAIRFGPAGLYEAYTHAKLDLDLAKGRTRQAGLDLATRRALAEAVAVELYEGNTLEVDFAGCVARLISRPGQLSDALTTSGLSHEEIATDFATCSFVTLDDDGRCRFMHKSFRGFFVARVIKSALREGHRLLSTWLEQEVLYFLGGFAPTQRGVRQRLWSSFANADPRDRVLRRNLLVAALYTDTRHRKDTIVGGEVSDAAFGRLTFDETDMRGVKWHGVSIRHLELLRCTWRETGIAETHVDRFEIDDGSVELRLTDSDVDVVHCRRATMTLEVSGVGVELLNCEAGSLMVAARESRVDRLAIQGSSVTLNGAATGDLSVGKLEVEASCVRLSGCRPTAVSARDALLIWEGAIGGITGWHVERSAVRVVPAEAGKKGGGPSPRRLRLDRHSVALVGGRVTQELLKGGPFGVFGNGTVPPRPPPAPPAPPGKASEAGGREGERMGCGQSGRRSRRGHERPSDPGDAPRRSCVCPRGVVRPACGARREVVRRGGTDGTRR